MKPAWYCCLLPLFMLACKQGKSLRLTFDVVFAVVSCFMLLLLLLLLLLRPTLVRSGCRWGISFTTFDHESRHIYLLYSSRFSIKQNIFCRHPQASVLLYYMIAYYVEMNLLRHQVSAYNIVVLLALITIFCGSIKPILGQEIRDDEPAIIRHDDGVPDPQCLSSSEEWLVAATVPSNFSKSRDSVHWACFSPTGAELVTIDDTKVGLEQCCKAFYHVMQMQLMVRVDNGRMHVLTGKLCWKPNQCSSHTKDFFTFLNFIN